MPQFIAYTLCGFVLLFIELTLWGVTAGPANALPYFILLGALLVFLVAAPGALFVPRIAACIAIVGSAPILAWPVEILIREHDFVGTAVCGAPALITVVVAVTYLWKTRSHDWMSLSRSPHVAIRIPASLIPLAVFVLYFNARLILEVVVHGP
jgi:hypothetical protein